MIYTSYFAKLRSLPSNVMPIGICAKSPMWYKGKDYKKLAPSFSILMEYKDEPNVERYIKHYQEEILGKLNIDRVLRELQFLLPKTWLKRMNEPIWECKEYSIALLCYERPSDFCHRQLVLNWLNDHGVPCEEWAGD